MNIVYFVLGPSTVIHQQVGFSIRTMLAQADEDDSIIYNLRGQRVEAPTKGLYIKNNKKYILK